ncbi:ANTAR domain-containing protein [Alteromonas aestuariivivens]|uniref:ANTAR domain-containing protein n=1 Tax=Alteromonas aestuariivivens TaxID=1938339 RepID=A0A3D8MCJ5_9ALTE|nr:nitrate regulatory protein [Alteromonas aestuariivivens]RDV28015.1 ANTAR domain-containing protein [Alteromonas aestuariivivens]
MKGYSDATKRFLLAAKHAEKTALQQLSSNCKLVNAVKDVIHQLQRERGISNVFLASRGHRFESQRAEQVELSLKREQALRSQLKSMYLTGTESFSNIRLLSSITLALQGMDHLPTLREKVAKLNLPPLDSTQAYCRLISGLLSVVFEAADVASDPVITRLLVALFNFMQAKEYAGQERAWGAIGFAETHFNRRLCDRLEQLQVAQQHSFGIFREFADAQEQQLWTELEGGPATRDVKQLRNMIQQLADGSPIAEELSEVWYEVATRRIDEMQAIEEHLTERLLEVATQRVQQADADLKNHRRRLQALENQPEPGSSPLTMLFDPAMPGLQGSGALDPNLANGAPSVPDTNGFPQSGTPTANTASGLADAESLSSHRSFYDLLRDQSEHIKRMSNELEEAKRAISEHKAIDRAKLIMMQQWNLTEDAAYRRLQKHAMDQNARISDVAESVIRASSKKPA